jgi:hexosaminidase
LAAASGVPSLRRVQIEITAPKAEDELHPRSTTCYNYSLTVQRVGNAANITSCSVFGAAYGLEALLQLANQPSTRGQLARSEIILHDAPAHASRGLMLDSGRRFIPVPLVRNLLDTMAAVKLNVLHLHASDMCRFGVESKTFSTLTSSLTGIHAGHYTQEDIKGLIAYASDRGIRVVPEFDVPGHSRGLIPLEEAAGAIFCTPGVKSRSQLYDDPAGKTYAAVHSLMKEMASLFPDEDFHIGCDETAVTGSCSLNSTFNFERRLATAVRSEFGKTAEGWEEILYDAGAATKDTIVNAWARHTAAEVTSTGRRAVESKDSAFYFTSAAPGGPKGWSKCWYDIATGVPANETSLLLGGEMSMWTDTYCYINQCGASPSSPPVGRSLFPPEKDEPFGKSIGGMIWPRGFVGAAAFWNYNAAADPSSASFASAIWSLNDQLAARGSLTCPTNCSCDQLTACGKPY